jgi:hypothetical protein
MDNMNVGEVKISGSTVVNGRKHNDGAVQIRQQILIFN